MAISIKEDLKTLYTGGWKPKVNKVDSNVPECTAYNLILDYTKNSNFHKDTTVEIPIFIHNRIEANLNYGDTLRLFNSKIALTLVLSGGTIKNRGVLGLRSLIFGPILIDDGRLTLCTYEEILGNPNTILMYGLPGLLLDSNFKLYFMASWVYTYNTLNNKLEPLYPILRINPSIFIENNAFNKYIKNKILPAYLNSEYHGNHFTVFNEKANLTPKVIIEDFNLDIQKIEAPDILFTQEDLKNVLTEFDFNVFSI